MTIPKEIQENRIAWAKSDAQRDKGLTMPEDVEQFCQIAYAEDGLAAHTLNVYRPKNAGDTLPLLISIHGGGWFYGDKELYRFYCAHMAQLGFVVVDCDYRLAPEHRFPAGPEDCYLAARELFTHSDLLGITPDQITLIGDSAGGNLAAVVSLMARDRGEFLPRQQILLYPATNNDHTENSPFDSVRTNGKGYLLTSKRMVDYMALYRSSDEDLQNPYYAPILCSDLSDQPRTLIITAEFDPLRDEGEAYGEKLREFGNDVEIHRIHDALHGFLSLSPGFKPVKRTYRYINDFLSGRSDSFGQVLASVADQEDEPEETVIMDKEVNELE